MLGLDEAMNKLAVTECFRMDMCIGGRLVLLFKEL